MLHIQPKKRVPLNHHLALYVDSWLLNDMYITRNPRNTALGKEWTAFT